MKIDFKKCRILTCDLKVAFRSFLYVFILITVLFKLHLTRNFSEYTFFGSRVALKASIFVRATRDVYNAIVRVCRYIGASWYHFTRLFLSRNFFQSSPFYLFSQEREKKRCYYQSEVKLERLRGLARFPVCFICTRLHYLAYYTLAYLASKSRSYYGRSFYRLSKFLTRDWEKEWERKKETKRTKDIRACVLSRSYSLTLFSFI